MNKQRSLGGSIVLMLLLCAAACTPKVTPTPEGLAPNPATDVPASAEPLSTPESHAWSLPEGTPLAHMQTGDAIRIDLIRMFSLRDGWAIGGGEEESDHVLRTRDGGLTWDDVTPPEPMPEGETRLEALAFFKNAASAWVVYSPEDMFTIPAALNIWFTQDAGETWQVGYVDTSISNEAFVPAYLTFADDTHGWMMVVLGGGMMHVYVAIYATSDGGYTWTDILDPFTDGGIQSFSKTDFYFSDALHGWLTRDAQGVDAMPHVFRTNDGGVSWERIDLPAPADKPNLYNDHSCGTYTLNVFSADSLTLAMKCRDNATYANQLNFQYASRDGGATWQVQALPAGFVMEGEYEGLLYFDENYGFALGRNIYQTTDGGKTWTLIKQVTWNGQFSYVNMNVGWAVAMSESEQALVSTSTGGAKWGIINPYIAP